MKMRNADEKNVISAVDDLVSLGLILVLGMAQQNCV